MTSTVFKLCRRSSVQWCNNIFYIEPLKFLYLTFFLLDCDKSDRMPSFSWTCPHFEAKNINPTGMYSTVYVLLSLYGRLTHTARRMLG